MAYLNGERRNQDRKAVFKPTEGYGFEPYG